MQRNLSKRELEKLNRTKGEWVAGLQDAGGIGRGFVLARHKLSKHLNIKNSFLIIIWRLQRIG